LLDEKSNQKNHEEKKLADAQTVFSSIIMTHGECLLFHRERKPLLLGAFLLALSRNWATYAAQLRDSAGACLLLLVSITANLLPSTFH
ncbi:hypothetical protein, partial [Rufibacter sediminis]|uniref:hypothetical protein n=1 Tax=Rufibacter sediminis TaxID=2762756 RepID=UPI0019D6845C